MQNKAGLVKGVRRETTNASSRSPIEGSARQSEIFGLITYLYFGFTYFICSGNVKKHEQLARSLRKMERTLDTVLRSINHPGVAAIASGMVSRSPSPSDETAEKAQALMGRESPSTHVSSLHSLHHGNSPRLHSLPDNELNPLGLLAEASLANRRAITTRTQSSADSPGGSRPPNPNVGVANDVYFKPGSFLYILVFFSFLTMVRRSHDNIAVTKALH